MDLLGRAVPHGGRRVAVPGAAIDRPVSPIAHEHSAMKPITFSCEETLGMPTGRIAEQILDLTRWPEFRGYGVLPGIRAAEFEARTPEVIGTRIRVTNTDGSSHVEEVVEWQPDRRLRLGWGGFSPPLSRLATEFVETWESGLAEGGTRVIRSFDLHARSVPTRPILGLISMLLKLAIARHLRQMREDAARQGHDGAGPSVP